MLPSNVGPWAYLSGNPTEFEVFNIASNMFSGTLPESMSEWTRLRIFDIHDNNFNGTIPESFSNWKNLAVARFDGTGLQGFVPGALCDTISSMATVGLSCDYDYSNRFDTCYLNETIFTADCLSDDIVCNCCTECF